MKDLSLFISVATLVILLGFITYKGVHNPAKTDLISDVEVASHNVIPEEAEDPFHPLPAMSLDLPVNASFAGEPIPVEIPDVYERFDRELQINTYLHSSTLFLMKRANRWLPQIDSILERNDIPVDFKYLPLIESALINDVSPKNAVGFWQILKTSGKEFGLEITKEVDERYDPLKSTQAACKYIKKAYKKFGNWTLVAASYNRGVGGIERAAKNQKVDNYYDLFLNDETSRYVFRILAIKEIAENQGKYGFKLDPGHLYKEEKLRKVEVKETIKNLIDFAKSQGINYKLLKRHNPWLRDERLTVKKGKSYFISIPII
ncbi:MAG: lytic transglycosylase domain-containing protein [Bacteroidia bacterium]|nr:lytic transglycosylase domain-containing protein [Bacteroidia bacterium]